MNQERSEKIHAVTSNSTEIRRAALDLCTQIQFSSEEEVKFSTKIQLIDQTGNPHFCRMESIIVDLQGRFDLDIWIRDADGDAIASRQFFFSEPFISDDGKILCECTGGIDVYAIPKTGIGASLFEYSDGIRAAAVRKRRTTYGIDLCRTIIVDRAKPANWTSNIARELGYSQIEDRHGLPTFAKDDDLSVPFVFSPKDIAPRWLRDKYPMRMALHNVLQRIRKVT